MIETKLKFLTLAIQSGGTPTSDNPLNYSEDGIPWVAIGDMSTKAEVYNTEKKITEVGRKEKNLNIYPSNTVLYSIYATIGKVSMLKIPATVNQAILAIKPHKDLDNKFLYYALNSIEYRVLEEVSTSTQSNLNTDKVKNFKIPFYPIEEQIKITDYLDKKIATIDNIIENLENQINELTEMEVNLITEKIKYGVDISNISDSGITWIGKMNHTFDVGMIKYDFSLHGRIGWQGLTTSDYKEEGPYLITGTDFDNGGVNWDSCVHISDQRYMEDANIHVKENDLLITKDGTIGKLAIAKNCPEKVSLNSGIMLIKPKTQKCDTTYLRYVLSSHVFWDWYDFSQKGYSTIRHLYQKQFYYFKYPLPTLEQQNEIVKFLDEKCTNIQSLIQIKKDKIEEYKKLKKTIIYECVFRKKEVC